MYCKTVGFKTTASQRVEIANQKYSFIQKSLDRCDDIDTLNKVREVFARARVIEFNTIGLDEESAKLIRDLVRKTSLKLSFIEKYFKSSVSTLESRREPEPTRRKSRTESAESIGSVFDMDDI